MKIRTRLIAVGLATMITSFACAGPQEPLEVGVKEFPSDIVLGGSSEEPAPIETPMPPHTLPVVRRPVLGTPPPPAALPEPTPTPPVESCPAADPFAVPVVPASTDVPLPPVAASYPYRNEGGFEVSGANAVRGRYPVDSTRTLDNVVVADDGTFTFDVEAVLADSVTTTSYHVIPVDAGDEPGIFVTKVVSATGDDEPSTFDPTPDLEFLRFPIETGTAWRAFGIDTTSRQAMAFNAVVENKELVDACGTVLDAINVRIDGTIADCVVPPDAVANSPAGKPVCPGIDTDTGGLNTDPGSGARERFNGRYLWGTQFGGVVLQDTVEIFTDLPDATVHRENTATISVAPSAAS